MNQEIIEEAALLLYRKVQVAIAFYLKKNCPPDKNVRNFAKEFQTSFRKKISDCNLVLERKIFLDELFSLDERFIQYLKKEKYPSPMEIDTDGKINPDYVKFSLQLILATEFLEALYEVRTLFEEQDSITSADIFQIFSKFGEFNFQKFQSYGHHVITELSVDVFRQAMIGIDIEKISKECISLLVKLFKSYLYDLPTESSLSHEEAMPWMRRANRALVKCSGTFAYEGNYQHIIVDLLHESIKYTFVKNYSKIPHYEEYRIRIIPKWRTDKVMCINALNAFTCILEETSYQHVEEYKRENALRYMKIFLEAFCKKYLSKRNQVTDESTDKSENIIKVKRPIIRDSVSQKSEKNFLISWTECLSKLFVPDLKTSPKIQQLARSCFNILLPPKERKALKGKNKDVEAQKL